MGVQGLAEATRQYQATLEARRALRHQTEGAVTFEEERRCADVELARAEAAMFEAWMTEEAE